MTEHRCKFMVKDDPVRHTYRFCDKLAHFTIDDDVDAVWYCAEHYDRLENLHPLFRPLLPKSR